MEGGLNLLRRDSEGPGWARPGRLGCSTYSFPLRTSQATTPMMLRTAITASQPKRRPASSIAATSGDTDSLFSSFISDLTPCRSGATRFGDIANPKRVEDPQGHSLRRHYPDQVRGIFRAETRTLSRSSPEPSGSSTESKYPSTDVLKPATSPGVGVRRLANPGERTTTDLALDDRSAWSSRIYELDLVGRSMGLGLC